jgi:hypothetical protein
MRGGVFFHTLHTLAALAISLQNIALFVPAASFGVLWWWCVTRPWAVHIRYGPVTVRDAVIYLTPFKEGVRQGYVWSREEICTKVRLLISEMTELPLDQVQAEATFKELGLY